MDKLNDLLLKYEKASNSHDSSQVAPYIQEDATYWFTDGGFKWISKIREAIENTWNKIQNEVYSISNVK